MLPFNSSFTEKCNIMLKVAKEDGEMFVPYVHILSKERIETYRS